MTKKETKIKKLTLKQQLIEKDEEMVENINNFHFNPVRVILLTKFLDIKVKIKSNGKQAKTLITDCSE